METLASFDGTTIAYSDTGDGPPTLMHHGFASDSFTNWVRPGVARAIVDGGRRAILIDARGHGGSDKPHDPEAYSGSAMRKDAQALLDHLGLVEVDVVGYSMGSLVALELALADRRVKSLVLGGAGTRRLEVDDPVRAETIARALEAGDDSEVDDPSALAFRKFAEATGADRLALAAALRGDDSTPSLGDLASLSLPTLVVNAERDTLVGRLESLAEAIPGAEFVKVPGDHISAVVKPEFSRAIVEFLTRH